MKLERIRLVDSTFQSQKVKMKEMIFFFLSSSLGQNFVVLESAILIMSCNGYNVVLLMYFYVGVIRAYFLK